MIRNTLYDGAFQFKKRKPWKDLEDNQSFAVRVGELVCCVNMFGDAADEGTLMIFPGEDSIRRYLRQFHDDIRNGLPEKLAFTLGLSCLMLMFVGKQELYEWQKDELMAYAKNHKISTRSQTGWPVFLKNVPFRPASPMETEQDQDRMEAVLDAVLWAGNHPEFLREVPVLDEHSATIPMLVRDGDSYRTEIISLPEYYPEEYPVGRNGNELIRARVSRLKKEGEWACELVPYQNPTSAEGTDEIVFPWLLLTLKTDTEEEVDIQGVRDYETRTDVMLEKLMEAIIREEVCPETIVVSDDRTEALLREWCPEMGIRLSREEKSEAMKDLEWDYFPLEIEEDEEEDDELSVDSKAMEYMLNEFDFRLSMLELAPSALLKDGSDLDIIRYALDGLLEDPECPPKIRRKTEGILEKLERLRGLYEEEKEKRAKKRLKTGGAGKGKGKKKTPEKSYVISVSLGTGCYRHIQISNKALLADLSDEILNAFAFDNDHAHAFFMDNKLYSPYDAYYVEWMEDNDGPTTGETSLEDTGLAVDQKFKYVFDFGEEWIFQCRLLKELDEVTEIPRIVRKKGNPPTQYPDWDEYDDEEDP